MTELIIQGKAKGPIWQMLDGNEPHVIGLRFDCGDAGAVYLTREQAGELSKDLAKLIAAKPQLECKCCMTNDFDSYAAVMTDCASEWKVTEDCPVHRKAAQPPDTRKFDCDLERVHLKAPLLQYNGPLTQEQKNEAAGNLYEDAAVAAQPPAEDLEAQVREVLQRDKFYRAYTDAQLENMVAFIRTHQSARERELREKLDEGAKLITEVLHEFVSHRYVEAGSLATDGSEDTGWMKRAAQYIASHWPAQKESK